MKTMKTTRAHPQSELLQEFLDELETHEAGLILHLVRCANCQLEVEAALAPAEQQGWTFTPPPQNEIDYESLWRRMAERREEHLRRLRRKRLAAPESGAAAWLEIGEAARAAGRLEEAEKVFAEAVPVLQESADPVERAGYLRFLARLRRDQRRRDEASGLFGQAARLYEEAGFLREHAAVLLERAALALDSSEPRSALADLEQAGLAGRHLTPDLACQLIAGLATAFLAIDRPDQSLAAVQEGLRVFAYGWPAGSRELAQILTLREQLQILVPGATDGPGFPKGSSTYE
jgi:tetratricopeptide (TPR) repeat protein